MELVFHQNIGDNFEKSLAHRVLNGLNMSFPLVCKYEIVLAKYSYLPLGSKHCCTVFAVNVVLSILSMLSRKSTLCSGELIASPVS